MRRFSPWRGRPARARSRARCGCRARPAPRGPPRVERRSTTASASGRPADGRAGVEEERERADRTELDRAPAAADRGRPVSPQRAAGGQQARLGRHRRRGRDTSSAIAGARRQVPSHARRGPRTAIRPSTSAGSARRRSRRRRRAERRRARSAGRGGGEHHRVAERAREPGLRAGGEDVAADVDVERRDRSRAGRGRGDPAAAPAAPPVTSTSTVGRPRCAATPASRDGRPRASRPSAPASSGARRRAARPPSIWSSGRGPG